MKGLIHEIYDTFIKAIILIVGFYVIIALVLIFCIVSPFAIILSGIIQFVTYIFE